MEYIFDKKIDRTGSNSIKWDLTENFFGKEDCLPLWVADSDWETAPEIKEALKSRLDHGVFGYTFPSKELSEIIINWVKKHYNWQIKKEWIVYSNGVVPSINIAIRAFSVPGDGVIIQPPVYYPFSSTIKNTGRQIVNNQLLNKENYYEINFKGLKNILSSDSEEGCKRTELFLFCNPHNPVGRVWNKKELSEINQVVLENEMILISDEIHADFIFADNQHIPAASLSPEIEMQSITLMAPSKTFNIAGLKTSFAIIPNQKIKKKFINVKNHLVGKGNIFGLIAMQAAYNKGEPWLRAQLKYLEENIDYTADYLNKNMPEIKYYKPEGTYLFWLDLRDVNKYSEDINDKLVKKFDIALEPGNWFGENGEGFLRMNIATPRKNIKKALKGIEKYLDKYAR